MAKFTVSALAVLSAVASFADAAAIKNPESLEARWFPTCDITNQGTRETTTTLFQVFNQQGGVAFTAEPTERVITQLTDANGVTTYISVFSASGNTETTTYSDAGKAVTSILSNCAFTGEYIAGTEYTSTNLNFIVKVYGTHT